jgi:hypothetical protein
MYAQPTIQYMPQPHIETYQNKEKCPTRANANKLAGMHDKGSISAKSHDKSWNTYGKAWW